MQSRWRTSPAHVGRVALAVLIMLAALTVGAGAQHHTELKWKTVDTEHFVVHYHEGAEATAQNAAQIAEAVYGPVTSLYDFEPPQKTHFILSDYEDYANGSAYFFDGKFEIWATNLEFDLRGTTQWLWNVITHEFVHMINIQASQRTPRNVPAIYLQYFEYETERRADVLTGYPNVLVSYPVSGVIVPAWFAEGSAQYMAPDTHHDYWDAHRDMILRTSVLTDNMLSYEEMSVFKGSLAAEKVYDHGFGLVRYIAENYGAESLTKIIKNMRSPLRLSPDGAFTKAVGKSGRKLYKEWRAELRADSEAKETALAPTRREGRPLGSVGTYNVLPKWSPDGKRLAWLSNMGSDFHRTTLVVRSVDPADSADAKTKALETGVSSSFCWAPDGSTIYLAKRTDENPHDSVYYDLYAFDLDDEESHRLTENARLRDPCASPDGRRLVAVRNQDGTNDLVIVDLPANKDDEPLLTVITSSPFGRQFYQPQWSPDGQRIVVDVFDSGGDITDGRTRDLFFIEPRAGATLEPAMVTPSDERMPTWDGDAIVFANDAPSQGFRKFDLYRRDLQTREVRQVTNVLGGAFYPAMSPDGRTLAYANFTGEGYSIYLLPVSDALDEVVTAFPGMDREPSSASLATLDWEPKPYHSRWTRVLVSPRVVVDEGRTKLGVYASSGDVLNKQSVFGGVSYGQKGDGDAFFTYENRFWKPTLFFEAFWIRKNRNQTIVAKLEGLNRRWDLALRYDAFEFGAGVRFEKGSPYSPFYYREFGVRVRHSRNHLNLRVDNISPSDDLVEDGGIVILPKDGWDYYRGNDVILSYYRRAAERALDAEINPVGNEIGLTYVYSTNQLSPSGEREIDDAGVITNVFDKNPFHQVEGFLSQSRRLPVFGHTLGLRVGGGWIDREVDDFFYFRLGSRPGLRGYTYYSMEGRSYGMLRATYRFPIFKTMDFPLLQLMFERLYGGVFYEAGIWWKHPEVDLDFRSFSRLSIDRLMPGSQRATDVGYELRLDAINFNTFPMRVHFEAAWPLDRVPIPANLVDDADPGEIVLGEDNQEVVFSRQEWRYYFGILFGY